MPDFELFQERRISGKGLLRVPSELTKRRAVVLYSDLIRPPSSPYYNANYTPPQGFFGTLTFIRNDYVVAEDKIRYPQQSWDAVPDITAQNLIAIKCMYKGVLQSFVNFAAAAGYTYISVEDKIKDYEYLDLMWDEVRVTCYADTALNLRLFALSNDKCQDDADKPKKPNKPPPPPPPVPPGTPVEVDPPYEDESNPDNTTDPFEGDEPPEPSDEPPGQTCEIYEFDVFVKLASEPEMRYFNHYRAYAPIELNMPSPPGFFSSPQLTSRGSTVQTGNLPEECGEENTEPVGAFIGLEACEIRNFTPSPNPPP